MAACACGGLACGTVRPANDTGGASDGAVPAATMDSGSSADGRATATLADASLIGREQRPDSEAGASLLDSGLSVADSYVPPANRAAEEGGLTGRACNPGTTLVCSVDSSGQPVAGLTEDVAGTGPCHFGQRVCGTDGAWGECRDAVGPRARDCDSHDDLNCDGLPDDTLDSTCPCNVAHPTVECTGTNNCPGVRTCGLDHTLSACTTSSTCDCEPKVARSCSGGPHNCAGGTQTCGSNRQWGECLGAPDYCDCIAGQTRQCSSITGVPACGQATCAAGQWNTSACSAPTEWCKDQDGDRSCTTVCSVQCIQPTGYRKDCVDKADCDDANSSVNPKAPADCTGATSCVKQSVQYSTSSCACTNTTTPANEASTCAQGKVCSSGSCVATSTPPPATTSTPPPTPTCGPPSSWPAASSYILIWTTAIARTGTDSSCPEAGKLTTVSSEQYIFCRRWGGEVRDGQGNYNHWWLWTDLDTGGRGWVPAYYIKGQGNDQADDRRTGKAIPDC